MSNAATLVEHCNWVQNHSTAAVKDCFLLLVFTFVTNPTGRCVCIYSPQRDEEHGDSLRTGQTQVTVTSDHRVAASHRGDEKLAKDFIVGDIIYCGCREQRIERTPAMLLPTCCIGIRAGGTIPGALGGHFGR